MFPDLQVEASRVHVAREKPDQGVRLLQLALGIFQQKPAMADVVGEHLIPIKFPEGIAELVRGLLPAFLGLVLALGILIELGVDCVLAEIQHCFQVRRELHLKAVALKLQKLLEYIQPAIFHQMDKE